MATPTNMRGLFPFVVLAGGVAALIALLMSQRSEFSKLAAENERVARENGKLQSLLTNTESRLAQVSAAMAAITNPPAHVEQTSPPPAPPPAPAHFNAFKRAAAAVTEVPGGLKTTIDFAPTSADPFEEVMIVIRIPRDGSARLIGFEPGGSNQFANAMGSINANDRFAAFRGTMKELSNLRLGFSVTEPVTATIVGSCGIGSFQVDIAPTGATIRDIK